jgi:hypothetical protein
VPWPPSDRPRRSEPLHKKADSRHLCHLAVDHALCRFRISCHCTMVREAEVSISQSVVRVWLDGGGNDVLLKRWVSWCPEWAPSTASEREATRAQSERALLSFVPPSEVAPSQRAKRAKLIPSSSRVGRISASGSRHHRPAGLRAPYESFARPLRTIVRRFHISSTRLSCRLS